MIREASQRDAPIIVNMIQQAVDEGTFQYAVTQEGFRKYAFQLPKPSYLLLVSQIDDQVMGYIDSHIQEQMGIILGLYVRPASRRLGFGSSLLTTVLTSFRDRGCHTATLEVEPTNTPAIQFYLHHHFKKEEKLNEKIKNLIMSKTL
ncbi:MAG: GNAT family N-acetyltransferase [Candidatus Bathyarchaeota archaeon]|nr:GNAT family N-acetyltransferase [Candidatus Bathyarchaeota archaeon]